MELYYVYICVYVCVIMASVCAQVAQRHFSSEELSTWSALDSPHVVRLLGAVSEGPNVVLFMDLKPGEPS